MSACRETVLLCAGRMARRRLTSSSTSDCTMSLSFWKAFSPNSRTRAVLRFLYVRACSELMLRSALRRSISVPLCGEWR
jgi:hypothetical protein